MAYQRYYESDLDLFGVNDVMYSYKPHSHRVPVLSAGGAYSGSSSYYSPLGSMIQTSLGQRRYSSYSSLGYQDSDYVGLGGAYSNYSSYGSSGLSRYVDLDRYDLAGRYAVRSPTYRSPYVPYLDLATYDDDTDLYDTVYSRRRVVPRPSTVRTRTTTGNLYTRRWYADTLDMVDDSEGNDEAYVDQMRAILGASAVGVPPKPTLVYTNVFVGTTANAENMALLKSAGITHILNCGVTPTSMHFRNVRRVYGDAGVIRGYEGLYIEDSEDYDLTPWLRKAYHFIERARSQAGNVLICSPGVSRSGAVAIGYMLQRGVTLLRATRTVKEERRTALCNVGFMRTLVRFARALNMLDSTTELKALKTPAYGKRRDDKFNIYRVYLESI